MTLEHRENWHKVWVRPRSMEDDRQGWRPHINWCIEHWGDEGSRLEYNGAGGRIFCGKTWYFAREGWFKFKREQDATLFALRWK